ACWFWRLAKTNFDLMRNTIKGSQKRDAFASTRDAFACATRKAVWRRLLVAFGEKLQADCAFAVLPRLAIHPDSAGQSDREKIASFRTEAGAREFRRVRRF